MHYGRAELGPWTKRSCNQKDCNLKRRGTQTACRSDRSVSVSGLSRDGGDVRVGSRNRWVVCKVSSVTYGHELGWSFLLGTQSGGCAVGAELLLPGMLGRGGREGGSKLALVRLRLGCEAEAGCTCRSSPQPHPGLSHQERKLESSVRLGWGTDARAPHSPIPTAAVPPPRLPAPDMGVRTPGPLGDQGRGVVSADRAGTRRQPLPGQLCAACAQPQGFTHSISFSNSPNF